MQFLTPEDIEGLRYGSDHKTHEVEWHQQLHDLSSGAPWLTEQECEQRRSGKQHRRHPL